MRELTLLGLIGLMDPPRPEASASIAACREAGILVKMITGDHRVTAAAVARELGLEGETIDGHDLDRMDDATLAARIGDIGVIARVAPEHKVRIVRALKARGEVVAMTGDGVNDAAALRVADIGVAMGRTGTDVTREAATMVLTDDNFATIVNAVREGRTIYDNIVKFLRFQLSTNVGALMTVGMAPLLGLPVPFNPIQILWVNIIMDGPPAMALAFDPAPAGIMSKPPRPRRTHPDRSPPRQTPRLRNHHDGGHAWGVRLGLAALAGRACGDARLHDLRHVPILQRLQRPGGNRIRLQPQFLLQRKAVAGAARGDRVADPGRALVAGPDTVPHGRHHGARLGVAVAVASTILVFDETRKLVARLLRWARRSRG